VWILWLQRLAVHCIRRHSYYRRGGFEGSATLFPLVPEQARTCSKPGLTELAGELLDLTVNGELVPLQVVGGLEGELTQFARVGTPPRVVHHMMLQAAIGLEGELTQIAGVGTLPRVVHHMML